MPYQDEKAGLNAIRAITESGVVEGFQSQMVERHSGTPLPLPSFHACPTAGRSRSYVVAIDGSNVYAPIPGALPCTEAGLVSLGLVVIDIRRLESLQHMPASGAADPRELRKTERGVSLGMMQPGRNAAKMDGTSPRDWFREILCSELEEAQLGGESFADTLFHLLGNERKIRCPSDCGAEVQVPPPKSTRACEKCGERAFVSDGLRIHEQFGETESPTECHHRVRDALEILALINTLRYLAESEKGLRAMANTAFVMDGPLAAFGTIAVLARAVRDELGRVQALVETQRAGATLLVMSGVKSGPFIDHAEELDRAPEPDRRLPKGHFWLPDNDYIRSNIVAGRSRQSKPWGELTYFGRPLVLKTSEGQRLVLNLAQPEAKWPLALTDQVRPVALADALATAGPLGVSTNQFLALRRVHSHAAIPLKRGTELIQSLAP